MSNTTTITPEERAKLISHVNSGYMTITGEGLKRALAALEQAEARAEKAEKELAGADAEITELRDELEDSRGTEKDAPNILCAIARLVGVFEHSQEIGDDMGEMTLDAVRDLLADKQTAEARALTWTHEPPKVAGLYMLRAVLTALGDGQYGPIQLLNITQDMLVYSHRKDFQWAGPIPAPID